MVWLACMALLSVSCGEAENQGKPKNIIPDEDFINLLVDFSLSESASSINIKKVGNSGFDSVYAFNPLLERNIRKSQYDSTLMYYAEHIPEYKIIYESVLERIGSMQAQAAGSDMLKDGK